MPHDDQLDALERKAEAETCFTAEEKQTVREMIRIYRGWRFVAKVARGVVVFLGGVVAFIAAYKTLFSEVGRWFK